MAARVASVSGLWNDTVTWGGNPVPVNADTFTINAGVTVEFNVDQSAMANGMGASVINGTLRFSRTAGSYYLKMNGNLSGSGVIDASDGLGGAYPTTCTARVHFNSSFSCTMNGATMTMICQEPTNKAVYLTQAGSSGQNVLQIDRDITTEPLYWKAGDQVCVCNVNGGRQVEEYTIQSVTSNTITLTTNLTNSKLQDSVVVLSSRNVKHTSAGVGTAFNAPNAGWTVRAEVRGFAFGINGGSNIGTVGGVMVGITSGNCFAVQRGQPVIEMVFVNCAGAIFANVRGSVVKSNALVAGCASVISGCIGMTIYCDIVGCNNPVVGGAGCVFRSAKFTGNAILVTNNSGDEFYNILMRRNSYDFDTCEEVFFYNCNSDSPNFHNNNAISSRSRVGFVASYDHNNVRGAVKGSSWGGETRPYTAFTYNGEPVCMHLNAGVANLYGFFRYGIIVPANTTLTVSVYMRKNVAAVNMPRILLYERGKLITQFYGFDNADAETILQDNSNNTWLPLTLTYTNPNASPLNVYVAFCAAAHPGVPIDTYWSIPQFTFNSETNEDILDRQQEILDAIESLDSSFTTNFNTLSTSFDTSFGELNTEIDARLDGFEEVIEGFNDEILTQISAQPVTVISALDAVTGDLTIIRGDSYLNADGRALAWTSEGWSAYNLTDEDTYIFRARNKYGSPIFEKAGEFVDAETVRVELETEDTEDFIVGTRMHRYDLALERDDEVVTLSRGYMNVIEDVI